MRELVLEFFTQIFLSMKLPPEQTSSTDQKKYYLIPGLMLFNYLLFRIADEYRWVLIVFGFTYFFSMIYLVCVVFSKAWFLKEGEPPPAMLSISEIEPKRDITTQMLEKLLFESPPIMFYLIVACGVIVAVIAVIKNFVS